MRVSRSASTCSSERVPWRPCGNSDGDGALPDTKVGTFSYLLLDQAKNNGWVVVSMKRDWKRVFSFDRATAPSPR